MLVVAALAYAAMYLLVVAVVYLVTPHLMLVAVYLMPTQLLLAVAARLTALHLLLPDVVLHLLLEFVPPLIDVRLLSLYFLLTVALLQMGMSRILVLGVGCHPFYFPHLIH
jgi:hypothetical protein